MSDQDKGSKADIIYTKVDEAPELARGSFLPIIRKFSAAAGVSVGTMDISLAGRIIANFPENLTAEQRQPDHLAELGVMVNEPGTNVIKLPNISASVPQLNAAIKELQEGGYDIPSYPDNPQNEEEKRIKGTYGTVLGSAVNPVLRQGNSDRRAPNAVKEYAKANPHRMGVWAKESKTHVATMGAGDFHSNEKSTTVSNRDVGPARIEYVNGSGALTVLKDDLSLTDGEVIDATKMSVAALRSFLRQDPDVIMVGEIRDLETANIAIKAAQTGHLVLSTLHTNSAAETLTRMMNMGVPSFNIATSVSLIIAQRLGRRLCSSCKQPFDVPKDVLLEEGFTQEQIDTGFTLYRPKGCDKCNGGYKGRVGIYEVVKITDELANMIMEEASSIKIAKQAQAEGFRNLRQSALMKVIEGVTSLEEANRVTKD